MNRSSTTPRSFSTDQLHAALGDAGGRARPDYLADIVARAGRTRQRPAWTFLERWLSMDIAVRRQGVPRAAVVFAALFLLVALLMAGVYIGSQRTQPERLGVRNGLIAFAADASAGALLRNPVDFATVETRPKPMDIYLTQVGEPTRRVIATDAHERCPTFSPDGHRLAYLSAPPSGDGAPSIVVVRLDAAGAPVATEVPVLLPASRVYRVSINIGVACPQWSPDGSRLAYQVGRELRVSTLDGRESVLTTGLSHAHRPFAWSPAGDAIVYTKVDGVWAARLNSGTPSLVWGTDGEPDSVSWSSRGELAVTVLTDVAVEGGSRTDASVHVVDLDTSTARTIGMIHVYDFGAEWSPDGSRLALVDDDGHVFLSDAADGSTASLSPRYAGGQEMLFWDVSWSPDGERLLALARSDIGFALVSLSTDGAAADVLTPWTWAMDWINLEDVSWQPITN